MFSILKHYYSWFRQSVEAASLISQAPAVQHDHEAKLIPRIIHQTYINESIPPQWQEAQQSCKDAYPDYEYVFWSDQKCIDFISHEYPWFLETFLSYPFAIQRADAIRYFILSKYGGIYIDLDEGCTRRVDSLGRYNIWVPEAWPAGISNNVLGASPGHHFFSMVIQSLQEADHDWRWPYATVMFTTGPVFLTSVWNKWLKEMSESVDVAGANTEVMSTNLRVLTLNEYNGNDEGFFHSYQGSSWHDWDAATVSYIISHCREIIFIFALVAVYIFVAKILQRRWRRGQGSHHWTYY